MHTSMSSLMIMCNILKEWFSWSAHLLSNDHFCSFKYSTSISVVLQVAGPGLSTVSCEHTSVASVRNQAYYPDAEQKPLEDRHTVIVNGGVKLYIVMDGHDSPRAADFALKCLPDLLLASDLHGMCFLTVITFLLPPSRCRSSLLH